MKYNEYGIHYNKHPQQAIRQPLAVTELKIQQTIYISIDSEMILKQFQGQS
jgi:hypothetical protein